MEIINTRQGETINIVIKVFRYLSNFTDPWIIQFSSFYLAVKRLMRINNSFVKIQNFIVNHKSQHVKSNPEYVLQAQSVNQ